MKALLVLPLVLGFCAPDETISGYADRETVWELQSFGDLSIPDATIRFPEEGRVDGAGPCNAFTASQSAPYPWIEISAIAATRRACPALDAEQAYFTALGEMTLAEVTPRVLILSDDTGREMIFSAQ